MVDGRKSWRIVPLVLLVAACGGGAGQPGDVTMTIPFDTGTVRIVTASDTVTLLAEIAASNDQHEVGLMERTRLDPNSGMIFVYPEPQPATDAFWMYRTKIPLDIAFVDSAGRIGTILSMTPCESPNPDFCEAYQAGVRYQSALEVNLGFFASRGIAVGDQVLVDRAGPDSGH
jgi:uncharacterized membrane protein (UPF0127 family)